MAAGIDRFSSEDRRVVKQAREDLRLEEPIVKELIGTVARK